MSAPADINAIANIYMYRREIWQNTANKSLVFSKLKQHGGLVKGRGTKLEWPIQAGRFPATVSSDFADITALIKPHQHYTRPSLNWGLVTVPNAVAGTSMAQNQGESILVNVLNETVPEMFSGLLTQGKGNLSWQLFHGDGTVDGDDGTGPNTGPDALPFYGMASIFKPNTSANSTDQVVSVDGSSTYAGLTLGAKPSGVDNVDSTCWLPKMYNYVYPWDGSSITFASNFKYIMNKAITDLCFDSTDSTKQPDTVCHDRAHWTSAMDYIEARETVFMKPGSRGDEFVGLGVGINKVAYNGLEHWFDPNAQANTSHIINWDAIRYVYLQLPNDRLNVWPGRKRGTADDDDGGFLAFYTQQATGRAGGGVDMVAATYGQYMINPRFQGKVADYDA